MADTTTNVLPDDAAPVPTGVLGLDDLLRGGYPSNRARLIEGRHEDSIREYRVDQMGIRVGEPLVHFRGVLTGVPTYEGATNTLLESRNGDAV